MENAVQIAWDVWEWSGEIDDPGDARRFLLKTVADLVTKGERRRLMLVNRAIDAYRHRRKSKLVAEAPAVLCYRYRDKLELLRRARPNLGGASNVISAE